MSRRVVITGLGMVSPLGNDVQTSWSRLLAGESGAAEITAFDHTDYNVHFACELKDFDPKTWIDHKKAVIVSIAGGACHHHDDKIRCRAAPTLLRLSRGRR